MILCALLLSACSRVTRSPEIAYVNVPQANLRDRVAALYNKTGVVLNGEAVEVLDRARRFAKVKTAGGAEGWMEERFLVSSQVFHQFQMMAKANAKMPVQARAVSRTSVNIHLAPGRDTEHLYQLKEGAKVEILKRATAEKPRSTAAPLSRLPQARETKLDKAAPPPPVPLEDWSLIRDAQGHAGWVLARMIDIDLPLDVAQYSEGQRIVGYRVLNQVQDEGKPVNQYLVLLTEPKDGLPFDYNQIRIFTWNLKRHRYETAYRERNLFGVFPVTTGQEDFGREGVLPAFTLRVKDDGGNMVARKYKLNGPIVRRVLSPAEQAAQAAQRQSRRKR